MKINIARLAVAASLLAGVTAFAQTTGTTAVQTVPAVPLTTIRAATSTTEATTNRTSTSRSSRRATETSETMPPELTNAIATMSFDRTSEALFAAVRSQQSGGKLTESEKFRLSVLLGDWAAVGTGLKTLPEADAMKAYTRLLDSLTTNSQSAAQFFEQAKASSSSTTRYDNYGNIIPQSPPSQSTRRGLFLSEDFYAVVDAAPADLTAAHIPSLTALIKVAIGNSGKQDFLTRLEKGMKGFGGSSSSGKKLAAQLLSSAGWMSDSGPYLPLKREEWDNADTLTLVLTMEYFTQNGVEKRDERQLKRAAEMCAFMMQTSRFSANDKGLFKQATDRFVKLLPALDVNDAEDLIRENFLTQPVILVDLILALGEVGHNAQKGTDLALRGQSLATQNILLRVIEGKKSAIPEAVNIMVMNWLNEAEQAYRNAGNVGPQNIYDSDGMLLYRTTGSSSGRPRTLNAGQVLTNAPSPALVRRLNRGLAQRVNLTLLKVNLINPKEPMTLDTLKGYLKDHPGQEKELCQDYLTAWVKKRTVQAEDPNIVRMRLLGYSIPKQQFSGIPLTRLRQNQNVGEFKTLLASLRELSPEPIDPTTVVQSFMNIHSGAEVYRLEDIQAIFGPAESMNRAELMSLITGMRSKLREQWRDPVAQQDAGTNRTENEAKDEVSRGYRTALELAKRGLKPETAEWKEFIVRGQLFFDASEYEFSRQIKLTDYISLRDEAFTSYKKASEIYAAKIPEMARGQWTMEPYQMWFFVMLGASDLSQLTRASARSDPGLKNIGDAMRALPDDAAEGHLQKFAEMLGNTLSQVPPNMKQRFLSAGLQVIGENHPSAAAATEALGNYKELMDEVQLRLTVDGPTRVGHGQPFGAFLSLEHSKQLARESGGFAKYIQSPNNTRSMFVAQTANKPVNPREEFAKNIHAALDESFDVVSITFHDSSVKTIDLPREGWQETPMAYLVLRSKNAAVDRIPSIQLDMDFADTAGQVVLPVRSQVQPVDSKDPLVEQRPCDGLALTLTMDEREWRKDGKVVIEVAARGKGVIAAHTELFDFAREGFDAEVTDNGLSVTQFVSDGRTKTAQADRSWQFTYRRKKDLRGDAMLAFPAVKPTFKTETVEYKHYQDADLVSIDAKQALAGVPMPSSVSNGLRLGLYALIALGLGWESIWSSASPNAAWPPAIPD
ncbi:MAG: hypothetical protein IPK15_26960 [Verrucomicrobia bacterium]|nr:hypothetical protein [Verrucomicrobiota bacterium]